MQSKFPYIDKMQNLGFVYNLYMFLVLKNCLVLFSKHMFLSLMTQWVKVISLITQKSYLSFFLMLLIKTVLFTFHSIKKDTKSKGQRKRI